MIQGIDVFNLISDEEQQSEFLVMYFYEFILFGRERDEGGLFIGIGIDFMDLGEIIYVGLSF